MSLSAIVSLGAVAVSASAIVRTGFEVVYGLMAKKAAQRVLAKKPELRLQLQKISPIPVEVRDIDPAAMAALVGAIKQSLNESDLTKSQLHHVSQGLNQPSTAGERRYIADLVGIPE